MRITRGAVGPARPRWAGLVALLSLGVFPAAIPLPAQIGGDSLALLRTSLAAADRAMGDTTQRLGLARSLAMAGADGLVLVFPGAPVLAGQPAVQAFLGMQRSLGELVVGWSPLHVEVSSDGTFGVSYGVTGIVARAEPGTPLRFGKYLSAWSRMGREWRLVAHAQLQLLDAAKATPPPGFTAPWPPPLDSAHPSIAFAKADSSFAALAGREGAERAFAAFASSDAVTFPPNGVLTRGPEAIGRGVRDEGAPSHWSWRPVAAGGSGAGDLGFTVGVAEIRQEGGAAGEVYYGKYLTLWRREAGGAMRFLADGGNSRPAPAGR